MYRSSAHVDKRTLTVGAFHNLSYLTKCLNSEKNTEINQYLKHDQNSLISVVFTTQCYASVVLAMALYPSQVGVLLKRLNVGSHKSHPHYSPGTLVLGCQRSLRNNAPYCNCGSTKYLKCTGARMFELYRPLNMNKLTSLDIKKLPLWDIACILTVYKLLL